MKEIGKARRKPKEDKFIVLDVSLLDGSFPEVRAVEDTDERATPSWWLGVRWTLTDGLNLMTKFNVELDGVGKMLLANGKEAKHSYPAFLPSTPEVPNHGS